MKPRVFLLGMRITPLASPSSLYTLPVHQSLSRLSYQPVFILDMRETKRHSERDTTFTLTVTMVCLFYLVGCYLLLCLPYLSHSNICIGKSIVRTKSGPTRFRASVHWGSWTVSPVDKGRWLRLHFDFRTGSENRCHDCLNSYQLIFPEHAYPPHIQWWFRCSHF